MNDVIEKIRKNIQEGKEITAYLKGYYDGQLKAYDEMKKMYESPIYCMAVLLSLASKSN